ncbi:MAG TPA: serine/threonine protein kinase [Planctomycetaceae bacterium]|nr:serine/threonine protein kinase [Planctomycetaceae bacterium]
MPVELAVDKFLTLLQRSGVVPEKQLEQLIEEFSGPDSPLDTAEKIAEELVSRDILTRWQANMLLQGKHRGFILGSYRIMKPLGRGGMGAVYLAEHLLMRRRCAIKVLPSNYDRESSALDRFYREAQAVAALDHPNIVRAYDVNKCVQNKTEIHYLVMEYVEGRDLQRIVEEDGVLGYRQAAEYIRQAAEGLAHAHAAGFVHRDIKPANLLIDSRGVVKILDLGLARFFDESTEGSLTKELGETVLGTADYLAPEQALDSHDIDARADIYSLGQTFYFLLTGHPPFPEGTVAQRLLAHQMKQPEPIARTRPDAPLSLVAIIDKMTAKDPDERYQSAEEVAKVLQAWLEDHPDDSSFLRETARTHPATGSAPTSSAQPTHPRASSLDETETEIGLAPIEESPSPSGARLAEAAGLSGSQQGQAVPPTAAPRRPSLSDSQTVPAGRIEPPKDGSDEYAIAADIDSLEPLEEPSVEAALEGELPGGKQLAGKPSGASSGSIRTVSPLTPRPTGRKPAPAEPSAEAEQQKRDIVATLVGSPLFWLGMAGAVVIALVVAVLLSRSGPQGRPMAGGPAEGQLAAAGRTEEEKQPGKQEASGARPVETADQRESETAAAVGGESGSENQTETGQPSPGTLSEGGSAGGPDEQGPLEIAVRRPVDPLPPESSEPPELGPGHGTLSPEEEGPGHSELEGRPSRYGWKPPPKPPETDEPLPREGAQPEPEAQTPPSQQPKPAPPDPQFLFARVQTVWCKGVSVEQDLKLRGRWLPLFSAMVARELRDTLDRMGIRSAEDSPTELVLSLGLEKEGMSAQLWLQGRLTQRISDSNQVTIWEDKEKLGGPLPANLLRPKVRNLFKRFSQAHREAKDRFGVSP